MKKVNKNEIAKNIICDQQIRRTLTQKSFSWFIKIFLSEYLEYDFAPFQEEMMYLVENDTQQMLSVMAFRNSGKSTILNLGLVLWSVLGVMQKKCVIIVSGTQVQAKNHFLNIKSQFENNKLLVSDMGPFKSDENFWGMHSLELPQFGAKILCIPKEQSIRGIRYNEHRPDLIICDDVEDTISVGKESEMEEGYHWFTNEVIPVAGDSAKIVVLGNLLHEKSLLMKLKDYADKNPKKNIFRAYPILDKEGRILWPQKFNKKKINSFFETIPLLVREKEYMLRIVPEMTIILDDEDEDENDFLGPEFYKQTAFIKKMQRYDINVPYIRTCGIIRAKRIPG